MPTNEDGNKAHNLPSTFSHLVELVSGFQPSNHWSKVRMMPRHGSPIWNDLVWKQVPDSEKVMTWEHMADVWGRIIYNSESPESIQEARNEIIRMGTLLDDARAEKKEAEKKEEAIKSLYDSASEQSTIQIIWESIFGTSGGTEPWWEEISILEGSWDTPGRVRVSVDDPKDETKTITKTFTALDLVHVYKSLPPGTSHCGDYNIIGDSADSCTFDIIMQWAFFGEAVYA